MQPAVEVHVLQGADITAFKKLLIDILKGSGLATKYIESVAALVLPPALVAAVEAGDPSRIIRIDKMGGDKAARAIKVIDTIRASGRLFELDTVEVDDTAVVTAEAMGVLKPIGEVSGGQHCGAVLCMALVGSRRPLLMDQPEHELGGTYIMGTVTELLAKMKVERQIIINTHSPLFVMDAPVDRLNALDVVDAKCRVVAGGTVHELLGRAEQLDGGRKAMAARLERYMGKLPGSLRVDDEKPEVCHG